MIIRIPLLWVALPCLVLSRLLCSASFMSDLPRRRGRLAASAVAFLLPARHDVPFFMHQTNQSPQTTCTPDPCWISSSSSAPPCPDHIVARPQANGRGSTRRRHGCFSGGGALFAAAVREDEEEDADQPLPPSAAQQTDTAVEADPADTELPPGGSRRIAELGSPRRLKRLRSTAVARAIGRVFRGRSALAEEHDTPMNSVVSGQVCRNTAVSRGSTKNASHRCNTSLHYTACTLASTNPWMDFTYFTSNLWACRRHQLSKGGIKPTCTCCV